MKKRIAIIILALILVLLAAATCILLHNYLFLNGRIYAKDLEVLDLSGTPVEDPEQLSRFTQLKQLDLRDTGLTVSEYRHIRELLPECKIHWLLPFQGSYLPLDTQQLTITEITEEELALLGYLPQLQAVDAAGCQDYDTLLQLREMYPDCSVHYTLELNGTSFDQDTVTAELAGATGEDVAQALAYLPELTYINAQGCQDLDTLLRLQAQYPQCSIAYTVPLCDTQWPEDTTSMSLTAVTAEELAQVLPYLPALTQITVEQPVPDADAILSLKEAYPQITFHYSFTLLDQTVSNRETALDFSGIPLTDTAAIDQAMPHFLCLETIDMCGCGISDEEMSALNQRWPDTLFVWEVYFGRHAVRTDVTTFMPWKLDYKLTDADADTLKHLTELICIDLGHMKITDSEFLHYMPKMQYLLIAVTGISDISGCANMPDLIYAEFFITEITDYSPLLACKKLVDLNISYNKPSDPTIFCQMTQLENLWFRGMNDKDIKAQLREALPNTTILFGSGSSTGDGWRELENYYDMRDLLHMNYMVG